METVYARADLGKRHLGPEWVPSAGVELPVQRAVGWQSQGGYGRLHPARAYPASLVVELPVSAGRIEGIILVGVFALYADQEHESPGATGAMIELVDAMGSSQHIPLTYGTHYFDALAAVPIETANPDGTSVRTIDRVRTDAGEARVDALSIRVAPSSRPRRLVFRDMMTQASFVVFHVLTKSVASPVCPFRGHGGRLTFQELGAVLRSRDREKFEAVLLQTAHALASCEDVEEARGAAMLFLANVCAHMLDMGGPRSRHRFVAALARRLEACQSLHEVAELTMVEVDSLVVGLFGKPADTSAETVRRSLEMVAKFYASPLKDSAIAKELGLSPSHFRFLFRQQTSKPFHQYVLTYRLNRAKDLLRTSTMPIQLVAQSCGFTSQAHFCRAFAKVAGMVPTAYREQQTRSSSHS